MRWRLGYTSVVRHRGPRRGPVSAVCATRDGGRTSHGVSFREACDRGYLRPYEPHRVPDAEQAALVEEAAAQDVPEQGMTPRDGP